MQVSECPVCREPINPQLIDLKHRTFYCDWCQKSYILQKKRSTNSNLTSTDGYINKAFKLFMEGHFAEAKQLVISKSNDEDATITEQFIIAFYDANISLTKNQTFIDDLFKKKLEDMFFEIEDENNFKEMAILTANYIQKYEYYILKKFNDFDDPNELADFCEKFSPGVILARKNFDWLNEDMIKLYTEISKKCPIPKTSYALLMSLMKNPDSPIASNTFHLKTKSKRIYSEIIVPISDVFENITDKELKSKFDNTYKKIKDKFESEIF